MICDEYGVYAADSVAIILSQARKYRLQMVLASQHLGLVEENIRAAISGNVGTHVSFRLGATDAPIIAREFGDVYPPAIFTDLSNYEVLVKDSTSASASDPFRGTTHPPIGIAHGRAPNLIRHCRERYGTPKALVEERLLRWLRQGSG